MLIYGYADMTASKLVYGELTYELNGILFAVHNELGRYRNEKQYSDEIERLLKLRGIPYEREKIVPESFAGELPGRNIVDFLIAGKIVLEVKTKRLLEKSDYYQTKRYLAALGKKLAILVNFRDKVIKPRRILNSSASE